MGYLQLENSVDEEANLRCVLNGSPGRGGMAALAARSAADDIARVVDIMARKERLRAAGWRVRDWRPGPRTPLATRDPSRFWQWRSGAYHSLVDHQYRLTHRDGRVVYVTEPYWGPDRDHPLIATLRQEGWIVVFRPELGLWNPPSTTAIWIYRAPIGAD